jgi:hypothetical protein
LESADIRHQIRAGAKSRNSSQQVSKQLVRTAAARKLGRNPAVRRRTRTSGLKTVPSTFVHSVWSSNFLTQFAPSSSRGVKCSQNRPHTESGPDSGQTIADSDAESQWIPDCIPLADPGLSCLPRLASSSQTSHPIVFDEPGELLIGVGSISRRSTFSTVDV